MNKRYYSYNRIHPLAHVFSEGDYLPRPANNLPIGSTIMGAVGTGLGEAMSGGNKHVVGDFIYGVGNVVGAVNPVIGLALNTAGGLFKGLFGSNVNQDAVESAIDNYNNAASSLSQANSFDDLYAWEDTNFSNQDFGSQGFFNHDLDREMARIKDAEARMKAMRGHAANRINAIQNRQLMDTAFANGGSIHINPSKKGTFTAQATKMGMGVQEAASHILANKENYSPAMVKKANFAKNASKWHADGGPIFKTNYDMGLTFVNAGGTHEQNPYGGVFMGMAPDGQPNQVEEGEVIFNDYVYSNRLKVPKAVRNKYKLREKKDLSFADAVEEYIKKNGIEERNNDPIANRGLEAFASELAMEQEMVKAKKEMKESRQAAFGGHLFPNGGTTQYGNYTGDYSQAWGNYVMPGVEKYFTDALAEYSAATDDAARAAIRQRIMDQVNDIQKSYAGISSSPLGTRNKNIGAHQALFNAAGGNRGFNGNNASIPGIDSLIKRGYRGGTGDNAAGSFAPDNIYGWRTNLRHFGSDSPEDVAAMERIASMAKQMNMNWEATLADPGHEGRNLYMLSDFRSTDNPLPNGPEITGPGLTPPNTGLKRQDPRKVVTSESVREEENNSYDPTYWWRMAGLGANDAGLMYNIFDPYHPQVVNEAGYSTISPKYIGDYMEYRPYDINYATSQQDANSAATRNALMQSSAPIRNALLLANDFNNNATRGATRRQALEYNDALRKAVADFNRGTNQFNTQMYMDAATKNQAARQAYYQDRLRQAQFNSQLDFQHKAMRDQAIGQGLTAIGDYLNDMGREDIAAGMADAVIKSGVPLNSPMSTMYSDFLNRRAAREQRRATKKSKK